MHFSVFRLGYFFIFLLALSSMAAAFMDAFEQQMDQFNRKMQETFGNNNYRPHSHVNNFMGSGFPFSGNNQNWIKQFANPSVPVFPPNFPWPPNCRKVPDVPGLQYPDPEENVNVQILTYPPTPVYKTIRYQTYECTDPRYSNPFYLLQSTINYTAGRSASQSNSSSGKVKYYDLDGNQFDYQPQVLSKPLFN